jgi:Protein of unknown function (DUF2865)
MKHLLLLVLAAACLAGVGVVLPRGDGAVRAGPLQPANSARSLSTPERVTPADWFDQIFRSLRGDSSSDRGDRPIIPFGDDEERQGRSSEGGYFRTVCVRLCDGFPIPLSFSKPRSQFGKDARRCAQACPAGRLFVYRNPGAAMEDMVDLDGRPYRRLATAFLHQTRHVENCTCHGNPWDQEATARHKAYAEQAAQRQAAQVAVESERNSKPGARSEGRPNRPSRWVQSRSDDTERR